MCGSRLHCCIFFTRYFLIQKAKEAATVGILMGTLGAGMWLKRCAARVSSPITVADYLEIAERIKAVLKCAGKKVC